MNTDDNFPSGQMDLLLESLKIILAHYNIHSDPAALTTGLPLVNHRLTPQLFVRAAERAGFHARIIARPLKKISNLTLPAVLILKNNQCCVLKHWQQDIAEIYLPETGHSVVTKTFDELNENYTGYAILISPITAIHPDVETTAHHYHTDKRSWFWGVLWEYRYTYLNVILAALFINIFALLTPLFVMNVYDRVVPNNALVTLWTLAFGIIIIYCFEIILRFLRSYLIDIVGKKADIRMAAVLFQKILSIEMRHKPASVGAFVSNLRDFESVRDFFTSGTVTTLVDLPFIILYIILIGYIGSYIIFVPLVAIPLVLIIVWLTQKSIHQTIQQTIEANAKKNAIMVESLTGLEAIKILRAESLIQHKWEQAVGVNARYSLKSRSFSASVSHFTYLIQQLMVVVIVILGVYEIQDGLLTLGGLIACSILSGRMMGPLTQLVGLITRYQQAKFALIGLNDLMQMDSEMATPHKYIHRDTVKGDIEFQHVAFQYPGQEQSKALINVSFKIQSGERVALLGKVGSGKTTLQRLLLGLYYPNEGSIYIDDADILQWNPLDLRKNIGYVPQDVLLFAGSVRDNIVMGAPWATDAEVIKAAKLSGVDSFISHHPLGYHLPVHERGEGLSGGQRQTIAIARALLTDPPLLLFDEPTSSMDERLERDWINHMRTYLPGKTLLLATHKASLLALVTRIIVLDRGRLVLDGPRDEVLQKLAQSTKPV